MIHAFPSWELCGDLSLSMAIQTDPSGPCAGGGIGEAISEGAHCARSLGRPDVTDGPPYKRASSLFGLAPFENIFLKLTPRIFGDVKKGSASAETFFPRVVEVFGSDRLAWGSNFPASEGKLKQNLETAKNSLACLSGEDQAWVFGKTAETLYPALA